MKGKYIPMAGLWALLVGFLLMPAVGSASVSEGEGQGPFGLTLAFMDRPRLEKPARLAVHMNGRYDSTTTGVARLRLPEGVLLVSGDTLLRGHPAGRDNQWVLLVSVEKPGPYEIRGRLTIETAVGVDEGDVVLPFHVRTDSSIVEWSHLVRSESVRNGQRFRYGGRFLVPIDGPQEITQTDIERSGQRASGPRELETSCAGCKDDLPQTVPMVAFIGADGRVVSSRLRTPLKRLGDDIVAAARQVVSGAEFRPARAKGRAVADWVLVDVRVARRK